MWGISDRVRRVIVSAFGVGVMAVVAVAVPANASARVTVSTHTAVVKHVTVATPGLTTRHTNTWEW